MANKKKKKLVQKPYQRGALADQLLLKRSLSVAGYILTTYLLYLIVGTILVFDGAFGRILTNGLLILLSLGLVYANGLNAGVADVTYSEIIYQRKESGRQVSPADAARCFHPLKGFLNGMVGSVPFFIICLVLALTAQLQTFSLGPLPDWLEGFERRPEIGGALTYYHQPIQMELTDYVRIIVRVMMMPYMNIVGSDNALALLWLERFSPLLCLLPAVAYAVGYQGGPKARSQVHTDIAASQRKRKRQEEKRRKARAAQEPERLI